MYTKKKLLIILKMHNDSNVYISRITITENYPGLFPLYREIYFLIFDDFDGVSYSRIADRLAVDKELFLIYLLFVFYRPHFCYVQKDNTGV